LINQVSTKQNLSSQQSLVHQQMSECPTIPSTIDWSRSFWFAKNWD